MEELSLVPTRCSALQNVGATTFQVVVHKNKKKGVVKESVLKDQLIGNKEEKNEMDMKKVRYEVFKFGMSGFKGERKEEAKVALAIKLGAKPPRNKGYNYKEYKLMKEKQLKEQLEQQKVLAAGKSKTGKAKAGTKDKQVVSGKGKIKKGGILERYGKARISAKIRKR